MIADDELSTPTVNTPTGQGVRIRLERGAMVGRYVVLDELGAGGMGVIYKAYDPELNRQLALKLLQADETGRHRERLLREAQALAQLSHPNVLAVHDVGSFGTQVFIATEFVDGETLRHWLRTPRSRREILHVFRAAGEGLAAAHRAGLVHRDFKPDNVMVGRDGRVRVLDFGLVRLAGERSASDPGHASPTLDVHETVPPAAQLAEDASPTPPTRPPKVTTPASDQGRPSPQLSTSNRLLVPLTHAGSVMGTPRYMAPEQHLGHDVDARADQFSFCLSLYEALYGSVPFADRQASIDGRIDEPPATARVPRWLRQVLLHGLAAKPASRYPTMDALLSALAQDPSISWRKRAVAAGVALTIAAAAIVERKSIQSHSQLCKGAEHRLAGIWDDSVRERTRRAIFATGDRSASQVWSSLRDALDAYARHWAASHTEACLETRVRGEQSENVLALKMACFDTRLNEMSALVGELQTPDRELVQHAVESTSHLSSLRQCADVAALTAAVPPPNADVAARVDGLRRRLAEAHAYNISGRYDKGLAVVTAIVADARKLGYKPVLAQALDEDGDLLTRAGRSAAAEPLLVDAFAAAYASNDHVRVAQAATHLVGAVGVWLGRKLEGHHWAELGLAAVERLGGNDELRADLLAAKAAIYTVAGENGPEAVALATEALALLERTATPDSLPIALAHGRLGSAYSVAHNVPAALEEKERALRLLLRLLGPDHPQVAAVLTNLCDTNVLAGRYDVAITLGRRALAIHEANLGPEHPSIGIDLVNLGLALGKAGQCSAAVDDLRRAVTIGEKASSDVIQSEARRGLGSCLRQLGRPGEARVVLERALAACEQRHDGDCVAEERYELAQTSWDLHDPARAIALARESAAAGPGDSPERFAAVKKWLDEHVSARR